MRRVHSTQTLAEAYMARDALSAEGIAAVVRGEHLVGVNGGIPWDIDAIPSVWVSEADAERATSLLAVVLHTATAGDAWTCPQCGEELEGQFTDCWRCDTSRADL